MCNCIKPCDCLPIVTPCGYPETPETCCEAEGCPINLSTNCVFYNLDSTESSKLLCTNLENGASLSLVLEELDKKLCEVSAINVMSYDLPCLNSKYIISNFQDVLEAIDSELCSIDLHINNNYTSLHNDITAVSTLVNSIYTPNITDCGTLGLLPADTIKVVLQKYANKICTILSTCCTDDSPVLSAVNSQTLSFTQSGVKGHTLTGSVKVSSLLGNLIETKPDGLYCAVTLVDYTQVLSFDSLTKILTLSNGGGSVLLNIDTDAQTLSFNCLTKILSISNGNSIDLSCIASGGFSETPLVAVDSATIDFTISGASGHILTGDVIIPALVSGDPTNALSYDGTGLYVNSVDDQVKVSAADPTAGYLENKIIGKNNTLIATAVTTNVGTFKSEVESVLDVSALLSLFQSNPAFLATICNIVKGCSCYTFRITNTDAVSNTYSFVNCSGVSTTGLTLTAGASVTICGRSASSTNGLVVIENLGNC